jgi:methylenetetrahydrofolate dehydrogenase (NADP+)/methenyltetrahydrofolate cyclohydrolase
MKLLDGRTAASFIKQRHIQVVASLDVQPRLAIVRSEENDAGDKYLKMKRAYGDDIGVAVDLYIETPDSMPKRIKELNKDAGVSGILIQMPIGDEQLTKHVLDLVDKAKDVDGLTPNSPFETGTPKAILWLLAAFNVDIKGHIVVVGQGRLVGQPLADRLEAAGHEVTRCDVNTKDLKAETIKADMLFTATGIPNLITADMLKQGAVVVDAGSPRNELDESVYDREDLTVSPNPGGVGPMTVAALFDNLLIAAQSRD